MAANDESLDRTLRALADPTRRKLLAIIGREPGLTTADLARWVKGMTRWGVMKHLATLNEAGLIQSMPQGRHTRHFGEPQGLAQLRRWLETNGG